MRSHAFLEINFSVILKSHSNFICSKWNLIESFVWSNRIPRIQVRLESLDFPSFINASDVFIVAHIHLAAKSILTLPVIVLSFKNLFLFVYHPDGTVMTDWSPNTPAILARDVFPFAFVPCPNKLVGTDTDIFVFTSSRDLSQLARKLLPLSFNAISKIDFIFFSGSNDCLIIGNIDCSKLSIELDFVPMRSLD